MQACHPSELRKLKQGGLPVQEHPRQLSEAMFPSGSWMKCWEYGSRVERLPSAASTEEGEEEKEEAEERKRRKRRGGIEKEED